MKLFDDCIPHSVLIDWAFLHSFFGWSMDVLRSIVRYDMEFSYEGMFMDTAHFA